MTPKTNAIPVVNKQFTGQAQSIAAIKMADTL